MKTTELTGLALDWAVAKAWQPVYSDAHLVQVVLGCHATVGAFRPSTNWAHGGPVIEREWIGLCRNGKRTFSNDNMRYEANVIKNQDDPPPCRVGFRGTGPTALVAAMRCYVASKLGDEIEIPKELLNAHNT